MTCAVITTWHRKYRSGEAVDLSQKLYAISYEEGQTFMLAKGALRR